jgi:hypothetical protein
MASIFMRRELSHTTYERLLQPLLGAAFIVPMMYLMMHGQMRILATLIFLVVLLILWRISRTLAMCATFAYLTLLGDIRRIVDMSAGSAGLDPLLIVGAIFSLYLALPLFFNLRLTDKLSKIVIALLGVMILEIFNPKQGSLFVGISAGLFWVVPIFWFWIGRSYATEEMVSKILLGVIAPLGIAAAFLGLYQNFVGFLPWEQAWINTAIASGYTALSLGYGKIRAFGFSVSAVEFVISMVVTTMIIAPLIKSKKAIYSIFLPVLFAAIFLGSSRTAILRVIFGFAAIWSVRGYAERRGKVVPRMILAFVLGLGALGYSVSHVASDEATLTDKSSKADVSTSHVVQGLADPVNHSTAGVHTAMFTYGIISGFTNPVGYGLGSVTLAADKFGGGDNTMGSSEIDVSDSFIALGLIGGICFVLMMVYTVRYLLEYLTHGKKNLTYMLVGIFAATLGGWIAQGQYALAPLLCFLIGFLTKQHLEAKERSGTFEMNDDTTELVAMDS